MAARFGVTAVNDWLNNKNFEKAINIEHVSEMMPVKHLIEQKHRNTHGDTELDIKFFAGDDGQPSALVTSEEDRLQLLSSSPYGSHNPNDLMHLNPMRKGAVSVASESERYEKDLMQRRRVEITACID